MLETANGAAVALRSRKIAAALHKLRDLKSAKLCLSAASVPAHDIIQLHRLYYWDAVNGPA